MEQVAGKQNSCEESKVFAVPSSRNGSLYREAGNDRVFTRIITSSRSMTIQTCSQRAGARDGCGVALISPAARERTNERPFTPRRLFQCHARRRSAAGGPCAASLSPRDAAAARLAETRSASRPVTWSRRPGR